MFCPRQWLRVMGDWVTVPPLDRGIWYEMSCSVNMEAENDYQLAAQTDIVTFLFKKINERFWYFYGTFLLQLCTHSFLLQVLWVDKKNGVVILHFDCSTFINTHSLIYLVQLKVVPKHEDWRSQGLSHCPYSWQITHSTTWATDTWSWLRQIGLEI